MRERGRVERAGRHERVVLGRGVNVRADARDCALGGLDFGDAEVSYLDRVLVCGEQEVLRLYVAVYNAVLVRVRESGAYLFEIEERAFERQRVFAYERL